MMMTRELSAGGGDMESLRREGRGNCAACGGDAEGGDVVECSWVMLAVEFNRRQ